MNVENLVNIHWMSQGILKDLLAVGKLYTETDIKGLFVKIPNSNMMLHSTIEHKNVWADIKRDMLKQNL